MNFHGVSLSVFIKWFLQVPTLQHFKSTEDSFLKTTEPATLFDGRLGNDCTSGCWCQRTVQLGLSLPQSWIVNHIYLHILYILHAFLFSFFLLCIGVFQYFQVRTLGSNSGPCSRPGISLASSASSVCVSLAMKHMLSFSFRQRFFHKLLNNDFS